MTGQPLPEPRCRFGYTMGQVGTILGGRWEEFNRWMEGQTYALCQGPDDVGDPPCSEAHGVVVYWWDLERFLQGKPVID